MATKRRYRGTDIVNPNGTSFVRFTASPLPSDTKDIEKWANDLVASLDTTLSQLENVISGIGDDLTQLREDITP